MLDPVPSALIARLFLTPYDFSSVFVFFDLLFEIVVRKWIELRNPYQRNIVDAAFATACAQIIENLTATKYHPLHPCRIDVVVPLLVDRVEFVAGSGTVDALESAFCLLIVTFA